MAQRAAWPMGKIAEAHPQLMRPWIAHLLHALHEPAHGAVHRNIMRALQFCELPKALHGRLTATVFAWIADPARGIAARASAITIGCRLVKLYPDLTDEFMMLLEGALQGHPAAAIRSRVRQAFHALGKAQPA